MSLKKFPRNVLLLAFILTASTTVAAQTKSQSWIRGVWDGTGYQLDDKTTWAMTVIAHRKTFSINYPSLGCGGHWKLISINASRARFREVLDRGQDKCSDKGKVIVQRLNRNQILFLYYYKAARDVSASAVLKRRLDVSINGFRSQRLP